MNKKFLALMVMSVFVFSLVSALAINPSAYNGLHKGNQKVSHLYLYEKDPTSWQVITEGAWGKLTFDSDSFVFNGHGLVAGQSYTLINYVDVWPGSNSIDLGTATADEYGNVHLSGSFEGVSGKVWLVLSDDFGTEMMDWSPTEYLFEYNVIPVPTE